MPKSTNRYGVLVQVLYEVAVTADTPQQADVRAVARIAKGNYRNAVVESIEAVSTNWVGHAIKPDPPTNEPGGSHANP